MQPGAIFTTPDACKKDSEYFYVQIYDSLTFLVRIAWVWSCMLGSGPTSSQILTPHHAMQRAHSLSVAITGRFDMALMPS